VVAPVAAHDPPVPPLTAAALLGVAVRGEAAAQPDDPHVAGRQTSTFGAAAFGPGGGVLVGLGEVGLGGELELANTSRAQFRVPCWSSPPVSMNCSSGPIPWHRAILKGSFHFHGSGTAYLVLTERHPARLYPVHS
jgi:hypothetical protein